jgi:N-dimethylarginine dimethylaminohydrolase
MCAPRFFEVTYSINPWMDPALPVDGGLALAQWTALRDVYRDLGHKVEEIEPIRGLPDMVFAANGATVVDGRVLGARFRHAQRVPEGPAYLDWFASRGFRALREPEHVNEGEGDYLLVGQRILAGTGFRTDPEAHSEAAEFFGLPVIGLELVDPEFYHLDTALAVLSDDEIMYYPEAFAPHSRAVLAELFPDAIRAQAGDAASFGLNAFSDGRHVVLGAGADGLESQLREHGFEPISMPVTELMKAGGGVKCCTLVLRDE